MRKIYFYKENIFIKKIYFISYIYEYVFMFSTLCFILTMTPYSAAVVIVNWRYSSNWDREGWSISDTQMYTGS